MKNSFTLWIPQRAGKEVCRELREKRNMMESAEVQLTACRRQVRRVRAGSEKEDAQKVLDRSLDIYRQTVLLYHRTLKKPWNYIPGFLMGYREVKGKKTVPWICKKIKKAGIYMTIGFLIFGIFACSVYFMGNEHPTQVGSA